MASVSIPGPLSVISICTWLGFTMVALTSIEVKATMVNPDQVHIEITDNGPGIDTDAMNKIFIPFYTTKKKSSGIGLSLSQQIIQSHGGQLKVSRSGNNGTTFSVLL